jgi:hypothetical protein
VKHEEEHSTARQATKAWNERARILESERLSRSVHINVFNRVTRRLEKMPNFSKNSPKSNQVNKSQIIYNKAIFESPKHHKPCFETAYLGKNVINLLRQRVAQKVTIILGYFIL